MGIFDCAGNDWDCLLRRRAKAGYFSVQDDRDGNFRSNCDGDLMNKDNAKDYLPLVQAWAEGKQLQVKSLATLGWVDIDRCDFFLKPESYRIKPEPREGWVHKDDLVRANPVLVYDPPVVADDWIKVREVVDGS